MYQVYQVMNGDTIESIANKFNLTALELMNLNGINQVTLGEMLVVPKEHNAIFDIYTVQSGDNVYEIARRYNANFSDLLKLNGLDEDDYIYPNQELLVPKQGIEFYITKDEETMKSVADKLGIKPYQIVEQNETIYLVPDQLIIYKKS